MGVVYRAWDDALERAVALKVTRVVDRGAIERFRREARAVARLEHPAIVRVFDVGQEGDALYFVMERVDGPDLGERLRAGPPPTAAQAVGWVAAIGRALAHAHAQGLVHRDVKPGNILLEGGETPRLTDFGLALVAAHERVWLLALRGDHFEPVHSWRSSRLLSGDVADLDGDGREEIYATSGLSSPRLVRVARGPSGAWGATLPHPESALSGSEHLGTAAVDLDGDGAPELALALGHWRAEDLRLFQPGPPGAPLRLVARRKMGWLEHLTTLQTPAGAQLVALKGSPIPNRRVFPAAAPAGDPPGLYRLSWSGGELEIVDRQDHPGCDAAHPGDFDGDGLEDLALSCRGDLHVYRQRPDGGLSEEVLRGFAVIGAGDLDGDGDAELLGQLDGGGIWVLGAGDQPLPSLARIESAREAAPDAGILTTAWRRAEDLIGIGLGARAADRLEMLAELAPTPELSARARLRAAEVLEAEGAIRRAGALYPFFLEIWGQSIHAHRGHAEVRRALAVVPEGVERLADDAFPGAGDQLKRIALLLERGDAFRREGALTAARLHRERALHLADLSSAPDDPPELARRRRFAHRLGALIALAYDDREAAIAHLHDALAASLSPELLAGDPRSPAARSAITEANLDPLREVALSRPWAGFQGARPALPFRDDFEGEDLDAAGWSVIDEASWRPPSLWSRAEGAFREGRGYFDTYSSAPEPLEKLGTIAVSGAPGWVDYRLSALLHARDRRAGAGGAAAGGGRLLPLRRGPGAPLRAPGRVGGGALGAAR